MNFKLSTKLWNCGFNSFSEISQDRCREILDAGGEHNRIHDPRTCPKQYEWAYQNKWAELKKWPDELEGGKA